MDRPGFKLPWDEDHQSQPPLAGRVINSSFPEQSVRYASQPGAHHHDHVAAQADPAPLFQPSSFPQYVDQGPQLDFSIHDLQPFSAQNPTYNNFFAKIVNHPHIATHRDSICHYLRLPRGLWAELYKPHVFSPAHKLLIDCLSREYGRLPPELWALVGELKEQPDFAQSQNHLVNAITSTVPQSNPLPTPLEANGYDRRSTGSYGVSTSFSQSGETSPIQFHISSPIPGPGSHTAATTPLSAGYSTSKPQSPWQRAKGRAPKGERYKCPYKNCKHEPFRNAGNFNNHMRSCHAESEYNNRNPTEFLMPDVSPQPSVQGDAESSVATNASNSPLSFRRSSQEYANGDSAVSVGWDGFGSTGEGISSLLGQDDFRPSMAQGGLGRADPREASVSSRLATSSLLEGFRFDPIGHNALSDVLSNDSPDTAPQFSPTDAGPVGFGDFQEMEERRRGGKRQR